MGRQTTCHPNLEYERLYEGAAHEELPDWANDPSESEVEIEEGADTEAESIAPTADD